MAQKYMKESEVVKICCPALKDSLPRVGVLQIRRDLVKSLPGTCFMIQQRDGHAKVSSALLPSEPLRTVCST